MKNEITKVDPKEFGIEEQTALNLTTGLKPFIDERSILIEEFERVKEFPVTKENLSVFRELRLKFRDNRTKGINKWHEATKQVPLRMGQLIDAIKRSENQINETHEEFLERAEKHFENLEKERINNLRLERFEKIKPFTEIEPAGLAEMSDEVFEAFESGLKAKHEAKIQAEKEAEEKRLSEAKAEAERLEDQRLENERLKAEAEAREKEIAKERAKAEAEKKAAEEKAKKEREEVEAKLKAEAEARLKAEKELEAKKQAEAKIEAERVEAEKKRIAEEKKLAKAPVKQKLKLSIDSLTLELVDSEITPEILEKFNGFKAWANNKIENI